MEKQVEISDEKAEDKGSVKKQDNPLLRMFEKMREKNVSDAITVCSIKLIIHVCSINYPCHAIKNQHFLNN